MSNQVMALALSAILIAGMGLAPAFGQGAEPIVEPIVVSTDKPAYADGDTVVVTGEVRELLSGFPISLKVIAPSGNIVNIGQLDVAADRTFSHDFSAGGGPLYIDGMYTVSVLYGTDSRTATTTFEYNSGGVTDPSPVDLGDRIDIGGVLVGYSITGGSITSITPVEASNSLLVNIDATDDGELTLNLPREVLDSLTDGCNGSDSDFFVLVDNEEADFQDADRTSSMRTVTTSFLAGSQTIEIIGSCVIPEFGTIAALILAVAIISIIAVSSRSRLSIMPKY